MRLFSRHQHNWSKWHKTKWTETRFANMEAWPEEHNGIIRYCLDCVAEDVRDGEIWQEILNEGEL